MIYETNREPSTRQEAKASIVDLAGNLKDEFIHLLRTSTQLLRVELKENVDNALSTLLRAMTGLLVLSFSALMALVGIDLLLIYLLAPSIMSYQAAAAVVTLTLATILGIIGVILIQKYKKAFQVEKLIPDRTLSMFEEHAEWVTRKAEDLTK